MSGLVVEFPIAARAPVSHRHAALCRADGDRQFLVPPRRLAPRGAGHPRRRPRPQRHWPLRPQHLCRRGARLHVASCATSRTNSPPELPLCRRHPPLLRRRHARHHRLSHRPRCLRPALQAADHRQPARREGRLRSLLSRISKAYRRRSTRLSSVDARRDATATPASRKRRLLAASQPHRAPAASGSPPPAPIDGNDRARLNRLADLARDAGVPHARRQRRALSRARPAHAAGRRHLHPRAPDHRDGRPPARSRMPSATSSRPPRWRGSSASIPRPSPRPSASSPHRLLARPAAATTIPTETIGNGETAQETLERLTWEGAQTRYPDRHARHPKVKRRRRARAQAHRRQGLCALLPHRPRHRPLCPLRAEDPLPGPRLGRQLDGLLLPRDHRGRTRPSATSSSAASSRPSATSRPTSTSISSTSGAKR